MAKMQGTTTQSSEQMPHILLVDDDEDILRIAGSCLKQSGHRVSTAVSAEDARRLVEGHEFDAIVTDVMLPGEDGIAFLARAHKQRPDVPVIVMTGLAQLQTAVNAIKSGAFDFICKPFDFVYLRQVVKKAVEYARLRRMEKDYRAELEEMVEHRTDELKNALGQLEVTRASLLKAANDKSEFMTTITHEMRTPMNGVIGALDLLADADLSGAQREYLLLARQAADNMVELVDRVLSFSDGVGRGFNASHEALDLSRVIEEIALEHHPRFTEKGLFLDVRVAPEIPRRIMCDREQLVRLLEILLGNALKFTEKGGGTLELTAEDIEDRRAIIRMTVSDSGIGIPGEMIERIFEPFIQVDGSLTRRFGGTGLGLSIARQIALLLGGRLWADSTPGEGSSFHFLMDCAVPRQGGAS
ncbi:MAG: response regulator [Deltaproteobacteria bacterium]|nr:response regulator [Deltaproteobacteria bacterium]